VTGEARELFLTMNRIIKHAPKIGSTDVPTTAYATLANVNVPTLVVWGPLDVPGVIVNMRHAVVTIPHARSCELEGAAHLPSIEAPERFNDALTPFLRDVFHG
jgi:pimeloyl-ACP methyl ester carboxylesterase